VGTGPGTIHQLTPIWLRVAEAATRARCCPKVIYAEVKRGRLRAARIGGRRDLRFRAEWIDQWLDASAAPVDVTEGRLRG
jgi:excisionase family DNA binding protein